MLQELQGSFLFQCNYDLKLLSLKDLPRFYKSILAVWQELHSKTRKQPFCYERWKVDKAWANKGIRKINQMTMKTSPQCEECNFPIETTVHKFYDALQSNVSGRMFSIGGTKSILKTLVPVLLIFFTVINQNPPAFALSIVTFQLPDIIST